MGPSRSGPTGIISTLCRGIRKRHLHHFAEVSCLEQSQQHMLRFSPECSAFAFLTFLISTSIIIPWLTSYRSGFASVLPAWITLRQMCRMSPPLRPSDTSATTAYYTHGWPLPSVRSASQPERRGCGFRCALAGASKASPIISSHEL